MKVGDYVRTKHGIGKIIGYVDNYFNFFYQCWVVDNDIGPYIRQTINYLLEKDIVKTSSDILDLLQPMDLMYIDISPDNCGGIVVPRIPETYCELEQIINEIKLGNYILKGVVTKEQLTENMYKVESEVN